MDKEYSIGIMDLFHHIHHTREGHVVHHCGGKHMEIDPNLDYIIEHCRCNKHRIDKRQAIGHDLAHNEILVEFTDKCPMGGWHIESGKVLQ